jgi:hypothetical protein
MGYFELVRLAASHMVDCWWRARPILSIIVVNLTARQCRKARESYQEVLLVSGTFDHSYPHLARWVQTSGWIEIRDDYNPSFVRALDIAGIVCEGLEHYSALDEALHALEHTRAEWMGTQGFE